MPVMGAGRRLRSARGGSLPSASAFFSMRFMVWMLVSAIPLDCEYVGDEVVVWNPQSVANLRNSKLANGMLSATNSRGIPCLAKIDLRAVMMDAAVLSWTVGTSTNFEK